MNFEVSLNFDNRSLRNLRIDSISRTFPRQVSNAIFSFVRPQKLKNPVLVAYSARALKLVGLCGSSSDLISKEEEENLSHLLSGNMLPFDVKTYASNYCGYQFGNFAGQLGDGAAMSLGEIMTPALEEPEIIRSYTLLKKHSNSSVEETVRVPLMRWELNIKGAGITPFSRRYVFM
jgi:uncharacterized protein YdiU (UPF0061 family)